MNKDYPQELTSNPVEAYIVGLFWKHPEFYLDYGEERISQNTFSYDIWWYYFSLGRHMRMRENKLIFDDIAVDTTLTKFAERWCERYEEYGGYQIVQELMEEVNEDNFDSYYDELKKLETLRKFHDKDFPIVKNIEKFKTMTWQQVADYWEYQVNDIVINVETGVDSYNLCEGLDKRIKEADEKPDVGLPLYNFPILNSLFQGCAKGHLYEFGMLSGEGKSSFACATFIMSVLEHEEKLGIIINEESKSTWQNLMISTVLKYKFNYKFDRQRWLQGKFSEEEKEMLQKAVDYLENAKQKKLITFIPLTTYDMGMVRKLIKKQKLLGVSMFILDTFKSVAHGGDNSWKQFMDAAQDLYDICKSEENGGLNIHLFVTTQLSKSAVGKRYLTKEDMGGSKGIIDVASVVMESRKWRDDEKSIGKYPLKVWNYDKEGNRLDIELNDDNTYYIFWVSKNRRGRQDPFQVVALCDLSCNYWKEVGMTRIPQMD